MPRKGDPWYTLYILATKHNGLFIDETSYIGIYDDAKSKGPNEEGDYEFVVEPTYEKYTRSFLEFIVESGHELEYKRRMWK